MFIGGIVVFNVQLVELLEVGTCASGNQPYVIANECPDKVPATAGLMVGGLLGALIGAAVFAFRGTPPWGGGRGGWSGGLFGWGTFAWGAFFGASGAAILISSLTSESIPADGELGGAIVGITFLAMGVPALLIALWSAIGSLRSRDERPAATAAAGYGTLGATSAAAPGAPLAGLERLARLRDSGTLTEEEFQREKACLLAEMQTVLLALGAAEGAPGGLAEVRADGEVAAAERLHGIDVLALDHPRAAAGALLHVAGHRDHARPGAEVRASARVGVAAHHALAVEVVDRIAEGAEELLASAVPGHPRSSDGVL